jgi:glyceraldehyde 3-phosphate dehydrogenase
MAAKRVAINGFGRIGRLILRAAIESERQDLTFVAINDFGTPDINAHLLMHDTVHGPLKCAISSQENRIAANGFDIRVFAEALPHRLPWRDLDVDIVLECTGRFNDKSQAASHLEAGAKRVLVSAPSKDADRTIVYGVNEEALTSADIVVSNASCTTNCLAPVAKVLHESVGIERGFMTTIHAFTGDQRTVDTFHKDFYRARAAGSNLVPTTTGAAQAVGLVLPELSGKLSGTAIRVPTPNVSLIDLKFNSRRATHASEINEAMRAAASSPQLKGILQVNAAPLVSSDFNHNPASAVFDLDGTDVVDGNLCRVMAWYDNEWGFSNRMLDTAAAMARLM